MPVSWTAPEKLTLPKFVNSNRSSLPSKKISEMSNDGGVGGTKFPVSRGREIFPDWLPVLLAQDRFSPDNERISVHVETSSKANSSPVSTCVKSCPLDIKMRSF